MAGYLGTKAVLLSTTAADVVGNAEIGGSLTVGGDAVVSSTAPVFRLKESDTTDLNSEFKLNSGSLKLRTVDNSDAFVATRIEVDNSTGDISFYEDTGTTAKLFWDASAESLGIGTSSPASDLHVENAAGSCGLRVISSATGTSYINLGDTGDNNDGSIEYDNNNRHMLFKTADTERMRIDSSGNLVVGETSTSSVGNGAGAYIASNGQLYASSTSSHFFNRKSTDGDIATFRKDGSTAGSIQADAGYLNIGSGATRLDFVDASPKRIIPRAGAGSASDNLIDLGDGGSRFDDIYATNGTIQTSDRNEKQDIEALSDAEQRVAVACKGLLRKFRWKDAVAEKGDGARIHFGIIAQDLQDAFTAEGLDAGRYAMFISNTWWETQTDVPAVEAVAEVLDEDGNVVTEAVEAKEAYTRTDTYETLEEAPEGATERTRLGVRYPELLAFIIGAM